MQFQHLENLKQTHYYTVYIRKKMYFVRVHLRGASINSWTISDCSSYVCLGMAKWTAPPQPASGPPRKVGQKHTLPHFWVGWRADRLAFFCGLTGQSGLAHPKHA